MLKNEWLTVEERFGDRASLERRKAFFRAVMDETIAAIHRRIKGSEIVSGTSNHVDARVEVAVAPEADGETYNVRILIEKRADGYLQSKISESRYYMGRDDFGPREKKATGLAFDEIADRVLAVARAAKIRKERDAEEKRTVEDWREMVERTFLEVTGEVPGNPAWNRQSFVSGALRVSHIGAGRMNLHLDVVSPKLFRRIVEAIDAERREGGV